MTAFIPLTDKNVKMLDIGILSEKMAPKTIPVYAITSAKIIRPQASCKNFLLSYVSLKKYLINIPKAITHGKSVTI